MGEFNPTEVFIFMETMFLDVASIFYCSILKEEDGIISRVALCVTPEEFKEFKATNNGRFIFVSSLRWYRFEAGSAFQTLLLEGFGHSLIGLN